MRPEDAHLKGIGKRGLAIPALLLTSLTIHAREAGVKPVTLQPMATLAYLASFRSVGASIPEWSKEVRSVVTKDLLDSGVFRLLDPTVAPEGNEPAPFGLWKRAGADYLLRTMARPTVSGKLLMECECVQLGTQTILMNRVFVGELKAVHRLAHRLADFVVGKVTGTPGVADSRILFSRPIAAGVLEIFSVGQDGKGLQKLSSFGSISIHPALSADGKLAFVTYKGGPPQIWGQAKARGPLRKLFPLEGPGGRELSDLAWSPDGTRLAFVQADRQGATAIHVLDLKANRVSQWTEDGRSARSPSWKPDGTELVYVSNRDGLPQVFIQGTDGSPSRPLTHDPIPKTATAWSPAGDRIAYVAKEDGKSNVFTFNSEGGDRHLLEAQVSAVESLCWAPDGRWLLIGQGAAKDSHLHITGLDGKTRALPKGFLACQFPQWTRNGSPIASLSPADPPATHPVASPMGVQPLS